MKERLCITPVDNELTETGAVGYYMGVTLRIRRHNNPEFESARRIALKDLGKAPGKDDIDRSIWEAMAGTILVGWTWKKPDGEEVPFTKENAYLLLRDDPDARDYISHFSMKLDNFLQEEYRETAKK